MDRATIIIADDHPLFCDALSSGVANLPFECDVHVASNLKECVDMLEQVEDPDLLLLDLNMPGTSGFSGLMQLRSDFPSLPIVVVSATEDRRTINRTIELGASGFIPKSSSMDTIRGAVQAVINGDIWVPDTANSALDEDDPEISSIFERIQTLTPQQRKVLAMLGKGLLNKQIAYELSVSEATVKAHVSAVLLKLEVDSRTQAVIAMNKIDSSVSSKPIDEGIRSSA